MAKTVKTIAKLKNLYTTFGHEYTPYTAKEIKEAKKTITLPKTLEEYYKKIGSLADEDTDFPMYVVSLSKLSFSGNYLVFANEMQGSCSFAIKKDDLTLDNPPVYSDVDGNGWQLASSLNDEAETNFDNLLEFFYTIARMMGVDPEPRNTEQNVKIVRAVLTGELPDVPDDAITDELIKNITALCFESLEINNLQAITKLKNLSYITMDDCNITTIEHFFDLPKLEYLSCYNNTISNIDGVERMKKLKGLFLNGNKITDIGSIAKMESLVSAHFDKNSISDISVIASMPKLKYFNARKNRIANLPLFKNDAQLSDLRLADNNISNADSVVVLKNLKVLWLQGNPIKNTSLLKRLEESFDALLFDE